MFYFFTENYDDIMDLTKTGLVLEGGGLRGVYTSGVLKFFMDKNLNFPYVIGVSMGACNAANYISGQPERNRIVNISFVNDPRYLSYKRLWIKGELFGMDFIFNTLPNKLVPFDYETFKQSNKLCVTAVTDCHSGEAIYFEKSAVGDDYMTILQASSSLPFISKPVLCKGKVLMDGGLADSIPIRQSIHDGNSKNVIILTQPADYEKKPFRMTRLAKLKYPEYPGLCKALENRHFHYNKTLDFIRQLEQEHQVFVIRPQVKLSAGRIETNKSKLYSIYDQGYEDAKQYSSALFSFLNSD